MLVWLPYLILPALLAGLFLFFYFFIRHYIERDKVYFGTLATTATLLVAVTFALLLVPLDVYSVSSTKPDEVIPGIGSLKTVIKISYYISYFVTILVMVIGLPFCYFYYDAYTDYEHQRKRRITQTLKYTAFFLIGFVVLVGAAFVIKALGNNDGTGQEDWRKRILGELSNWEAFVIFLVSILSAVGLLVYIPYLSYGLSVFPIFLIKGRRNPVTEEREALLAEEKELKVAQKTQQQSANDRHIKSNASLNGGNSTLSKMAEKYGYHSKNGTTENSFVRKDYKLRETERKLEENKNKQQALTNESAYWSKCWTCLGPFRIVFGFIFLALSLLVVTQQVMSIVSRILNSSCGWKCGFTPDLQKVTIPNPFDFLLHLVAPAFPIDLILFGILLAYLSLCIIYSVTQLGVRIVTYKLSSITAANTPANSLVMAVAFIAFAMLSMNSQIIVSIPNYTAFGKQEYINRTDDTTAVMTAMTIPQHQLDKLLAEPLLPTKSNVFASKFDTLIRNQIVPATINDDGDDDLALIDSNTFENNTTLTDSKPIPCDFEHAKLDGQCQVTAFATFMQKSNDFLPFFSIIQLGATFLFVIAYFIFFLYALCKKPETDKIWQSDDPDAPNYVAY